MDSIGRKKLPHDVPQNIVPNPEGETYFITICCIPRGVNQLARKEIWQGIDETISYRESNGDLRCGLALAMPDHFHGLFGFPETKSMDQVITAVKSWMAGKHGIRWQRDFFDHRIRNPESAAEKAHYIRMNPVRAGLVERTEDWPYQRQG
jgi:REP element-mobilizing transposase RayT